MSALNTLNLLAFAGMVTFDGFFLGRLGSDALAGASLVFPWVMLVLQSTNSGMGAGVSSAVARAVGAGKSERANALVFHAFLLALALGAIFAGRTLLGGPVLFRLMGGQDDTRARAIALTGVTTIAAVCGSIGTTVAISPALWLGLFSDDPDVLRVGGLYLHIVAPLYLCFGMGLGLFFVSQGLGRGAAAAVANGVRLAVNVVIGLIAVNWLDLGMTGFFASVALGFAVYAALLVWAVVRVKEPEAAPAVAKLV